MDSLAPGRCGCNLKSVIFRLISRIDIQSISSGIALKWMPWDFTDDGSTLVQVMARCRQATSHYQSQSWLKPMLSYGVTRPQWVKTIGPKVKCICIFYHFSILRWCKSCMAKHHLVLEYLQAQWWLIWGFMCSLRHQVISGFGMD